MNLLFYAPRTLICSSAIIFAGLLTACGGGGSVGPDSKSLNASDLQGRWTTTNQQITYVIPSATGNGAEGWQLASDLQFLEFWRVSTSGSNSVSVNAKKYKLGEDKDPVQLTYNGTVSMTSPPTLTLNTVSFNQTSPLTTTIDLSSLAGRQWTASAGGGAVTQNLAVAINGAITGSSSTGCDYSGSLKNRSGLGVLDMTMTETCGAVIKEFSGIASYSSSPTLSSLTLVGITASSPDRALVIAATSGAN